MASEPRFKVGDEVYTSLGQQGKVVSIEYWQHSQYPDIVCHAYFVRVRGLEEIKMYPQHVFADRVEWKEYRRKEYERIEIEVREEMRKENEEKDRVWNDRMKADKKRLGLS